MTKWSKGLTGRPFTFAQAIGSEQIAAREAFDAFSLISRPFSLADAASIAVDVITLDEGSDASEFVVLDCLDPKEMRLQFLASQGDSTVTASPTPGLEVGDEGAFGVPVGGSVSGVIDVDGDTDDITVFLVAGQTYLVSLRGTGADPLTDPLLRLFAPDGVTQVAVDDDGGTRTNSLLTYTATTTGQHVIRAASFNNNPDAFNFDTGGYTVDVRVQGVDAIGTTNATSVPLQFGTTFGFREEGTTPSPVIPGVLDGDTDRYSITLEAGHFYTFEVAAGWDGAAGENLPPFGGATNAMNTLIVLRNSAGGLVAQGDNIGGDLSSAIGFTATVSGTYYLDVHARTGQTGGYAIRAEDIDLSGLSPLDAINWFSADNIDTVDVNGTPTAFVYFGAAGETFGESNLPNTHGWTAKEKSAVMEALLEFTKITGISYAETNDVNQAEFRLQTVSGPNPPVSYGAYFYPQDPVFGTQEGIGVFNVNSGGWDKPGVSSQDIPGDQVSLDRGGFSFAVVLHEFGHAHGLSHAHDNGGGSDIMPGVFNSTGFFSVYNLNQGIYTVMSYNDAWQLHPDGPSPFTISGIDNGWSATLSAFDIAVLQDRYGVHAHNGGDNVYTLVDVIDDAFYECIWDSGGTDAIAYGGAINAFVDLVAATLDYSPTGGGPLSFLNNPGASNLRGGFTIANGVVIENASTGSGNDQLAGNSAANDLSGNDGTDTFLGRGGNDALHGGNGTDTAFYEGARSDYTVHAVRTNGVITGYTVTDNNAANGDEGTDTLDGIEGLTFTTGPVNLALVGAVAVFDQNDNLVSVHTTIQGAIDAVTTLDGYRLVVSGGTYAEDVNVTKDLTIEGANDGVAGTDPGRFAETAIQSMVITASGVTVDGVSVTGSITFPGSAFPSGIYVIGNGFTLVNSVLDGASSAVGVVTQGVSGLDIGDNLFVGYGLGTYVSGHDTSGTIHGNLFQGDGAGSGTGLQNGVFSETSHVILDGNTFDGIDGGAIFINPHGPDPVDLRTVILNTIITDSGVERPIQVFASAETTHMIGTDFNEAFFDPAFGTAAEVMAGLGFDGQGGDDHIFGNSFADEFQGGDGSDRLFGGNGDDVLSGDAGNDLIDGEAGIDTAEFADPNLVYADTVLGWVISSSEGSDILQRTEIAVDGAGQRNLLVGATAFAGLQAALDEAVADDNVRLAAGSYSGTFNYDVTGLTVIAQAGAVQNVTYTPAGTEGITVIAANGADTITTGAGDDILFGNGGADNLNGGGGNDVLDGGGGGDIMTGLGGDDFFHVVDASDQVLENAGEGFDVVLTDASYALASGSEVEWLSTSFTAGTGAINLTGNGIANFLIGNNGANTLDGGGGADVMVGFAGDDIFVVDDAGDLAFENAGEGFDAVVATASYALAAGQSIEWLSTGFTAGTDAIDLTGNDAGQYVLGNNGANTLDGGTDHDVLIGFGGADNFAFTSALGGGNFDLIADFEAGTDKIALDDAVFTQIGGPGALSANAFVVGTAAADADDRIIYDSSTGQLFYDADGNGAGAAVLFATLQGNPTLAASDFLVI